MNKGKSAKTASTTSLGLLILLVLSCLIGRSLKSFFIRAKVPVKFHTLVEDARISGQAYGTAQLWYVASRLEDVRRKVAKATGHRADIAAPESQAVNMIAEAIEASDTNSKATLEDIKYASSDMSPLELLECKIAQSHRDWSATSPLRSTATCPLVM